MIGETKVALPLISMLAGEAVTADSLLSR